LENKMENQNWLGTSPASKKIEDLAFRGSFSTPILLLLFAALRLIRFALETAQFSSARRTSEGRRGLVGGLTHKRSSVKQNFPGRSELLQEIKIKNIAGQHGAAMLSSCGK
jgi:hypothetical protein